MSLKLNNKYDGGNPTYCINAMSSMDPIEAPSLPFYQSFYQILYPSSG